MRVLLVHNYYQRPGGEDQSFAANAALLEERGHEVIRFTLHNDAVEEMGRVATARAAVWNADVHRSLRELVRYRRPEIAHFENTFPLISPAAYYAAQAEGAAVVQTLQNFRLICPSALLFRDGKVCEDCLGKAIPWPSVAHGCYRDSRLGAAVVTAMLASHRALRTWTRKVDAYIALNRFAHAKFVEAGLPAHKIHINPHFLSSDPVPGDGVGGYALFVGRLTPEKGTRTLIGAWRELGREIPLKIVGDGPDAGVVAEAAATVDGVEWLGWRAIDEVLALMGGASCLVVPSEWYEGFGRIMIESFAMGTPVIASDLGSMSAIVDHLRTGLLFRPQDPADLAEKVRWMAGNPATWREMRRAARAEYETRYTADANYARLIGIYEAAMNRIERRAS